MKVSNNTTAIVDPREAIKTNISKRELSEVKKITKSMDNKYLVLIENKGHYIKM